MNLLAHDFETGIKDQILIKPIRQTFNEQVAY